MSMSEIDRLWFQAHPDLHALADRLAEPQVTDWDALVAEARAKAEPTKP